MSRNRLLVGGLVIIAAIVIAYFAFMYPPPSKEDTSGAIGVANKYRSEQISHPDRHLPPRVAPGAHAPRRPGFCILVKRVIDLPRHRAEGIADQISGPFQDRELTSPLQQIISGFGISHRVSPATKHEPLMAESHRQNPKCRPSKGFGDYFGGMGLLKKLSGRLLLYVSFITNCCADRRSLR